MRRKSVLLPAAAPADNGQELPGGDVKIDAVENRRRAECLSDATQRQQGPGRGAREKRIVFDCDRHRRHCDP